MSKPATPASETAYDLDVLETVVGPTARREFESSLPAFQPEMWDWAMSLPDMLTTVFVQQASHAIWESANMNRFRGMDHVHFKASAAYAESERRHRAAHPDEDCNATSLYQRAYNSAVRNAGYPNMASEVVGCTCASGQATETPDVPA